MTKPETKTDLPRNDNPRTESTGAPRFEMPNYYEQWMHAARENLQRFQKSLNGYWDEIASYENAVYERAKATTQDLASLAQDSINYVAALSAEVRRMSLDATRKVSDSFKA